MKRRIGMAVCWMVTASVPLLAQDRLYPATGRPDIPTLLTEDHSSFVAEKTFEYKLTLGFPTSDRSEFLPSTRARIVMLWLRIENLSPHPVEVNVAKFTSTDDAGPAYSVLTIDEVFNRIIAETGGSAIVSKTLRGVSLGRAGNKPTQEQFKEDMVRYSLQSGRIPPRSVKEGLIYFDGLQRKKFILNVGLGDLWSRPFVFSNAKSK